MGIKKIGIIGAGPAGSFLSYKLAKAGFEVLLFDHKAPWDKPCGGGLTSTVFNRFPELERIKELSNPNRNVRVMSVNNLEIELELFSPIYVLQRKKLEEFLIKNAKDAGASFSAVKILEVNPKDNGFELKDALQRTIVVDFLALAFGAQSGLRKKFSKNFSRNDYSYTLSLWIPERVNIPLTFKFFPSLSGYAWIFPGKEETSLGIAVRNLQLKQETLFFLWEEFLKSEQGLEKIIPDLRNNARRCLLPALSFSSLRHQKVVGDGWALVGDACGAVNPVSGEGVLYAFMSASFLAESIISGKPEIYQERWWEMCKKEILGPSIWGHIFYRNWTQEKVANALLKSRTAERLVKEILSGVRRKRMEIFIDLLRSVEEYIFTGNNNKMKIKEF